MDASADPFIYSSQALPLMLSDLKRHRKPLVLDFGPAIGANISYFSECSCKLYIEDLHSSFQDGFESSFSLLREKLHLYKGNLSFHLILCWDLLNYVPSQHFDELCHALLPLMTPKTMLYSLFFSSRTMPRLPARYTLESDNRIRIARTTKEDIPVTAKGQQHLKRMLPEIESKRSVLLRNGMIEALYSGGRELE